MKDNFWQMGETGPCGPCSEIHCFHGDGAARPLATFGEEPTPDGRGWMEIWNLVFMQFDRSMARRGEAVLAPLPRPSSTPARGSSGSRACSQGKTSNYDTDLFRALVDKAGDIGGKSYGGTQADDDISMRVIADHARTTAFLIAEGVFPDRAGREYVLRRVMRRAVRHGHRLGIARPFLHEIALEVVDADGRRVPRARARRDLIATVTEQEEVRFRETIDAGLKILDEEIDAASQRPRARRRSRAHAVFKLYDTLRLPCRPHAGHRRRARPLASTRRATARALDEQRDTREGWSADGMSAGASPLG